MVDKQQAYAKRVVTTANDLTTGSDIIVPLRCLVCSGRCAIGVGDKGGKALCSPRCRLSHAKDVANPSRRRYRKRYSARY